MERTKPAYNNRGGVTRSAAWLPVIATCPNTPQVWGVNKIIQPPPLHFRVGKAAAHDKESGSGRWVRARQEQEVTAAADDPPPP